MRCGFHAPRPWPHEDLGPGCQFQDEPEDRLVEHADGHRCRFHLPLDVPDKDGVRKSEWDAGTVGDFNNAIFAVIDAAKKVYRRADLTGVVFPGEIECERYRGAENALPPILFSKAHFGGLAWFGEARFGGDALFREAHFDAAAWFSEAHFGGGAQFDSAHFGGYALFEEAHFGGDVSFDKAHFGGGARFGEAHFDGDTWFHSAHFGGDAWFNGGAEDGGAAARREAISLESRPGEADATVTTGTLSTSARPAGNSFRYAAFSGAEFHRLVSFANRRFTDTTRFGSATFHRAPGFHNAVLHQDTDFIDTKFLDRSGAAAPAYRTLKLAMERLRARDEEGMFYAYEMESRRHQADTPGAVKLFSWVYQLGSDYGRSLLRPLLIFAVVTVAFYLLYTGIGVIAQRPIWQPGAIQFVIDQVVRPFAVLAGDYASARADRWGVWFVGEWPFLARLLATVQSLTSLGLFALFLLALRRRFRMV